ncbi:MAG: hypothetical protein H7Z75_02610 [Ferruginibacter sp.]|nr:hypothetical protein [Cytophagales bacterium]
MLKKQLLIGLITGLVFLSGCEEKKNTAETTSASPNAETSVAEAPDGNAVEADSKKAPGANIRVVLTGGERAGTYEAVCQDACCSYGIAGENTFGTQYSEDGKGEKELSSVQLTVNNVTEGEKSTEEFLVAISFGKLLDASSKTYSIGTIKDSDNSSRIGGSGTLDLKYSGKKATVRIQGKTKEGVQIDLTMECPRISTVESIMEEAKQ